MKVYDISQELTGCVVFPGDPAPKAERLHSISDGAICNLTVFSMCAHNGTHVDAPYHFINDGKTVEQLDLSKLVGLSYVAQHSGDVTASDAKAILERAEGLSDESAKRILIKGEATVTLEAAKVFADFGISLIGNESQTVGPEDGPIEVHNLLLGKEIVLLEGIRLQDVPEGVYLLCAAPISIKGADGSPCRAVLVEL